MLKFREFINEVTITKKETQNGDLEDFFEEKDMVLKFTYNGKKHTVDSNTIEDTSDEDGEPILVMKSGNKTITIPDDPDVLMGIKVVAYKQTEVIDPVKTTKELLTRIQKHQSKFNGIADISIKRDDIIITDEFDKELRVKIIPSEDDREFKSDSFDLETAIYINGKQSSQTNVLTGMYGEYAVGVAVEKLLKQYTTFLTSKR